MKEEGKEGTDTIIQQPLNGNVDQQLRSPFGTEFLKQPISSMRKNTWSV
jgi:hypothetical protein